MAAASQGMGKACALFLASERASYVTGATIAVDGGFVRRIL